MRNPDLRMGEASTKMQNEIRMIERRMSERRGIKGRVTEIKLRIRKEVGKVIELKKKKENINLKDRKTKRLKNREKDTVKEA